MTTGILEKKIRTRLLCGLSIPLLLLFACFANLTWLANHGLLNMAGFLYPFDVTGSLEQIETLAGMNELRDSSIITLTVDVDDIVDAGVEWTAQKQVYAHYFAAFVQGKYIICPLAPSEYDTLMDQDTYTFTGTLATCDNEIRSMILDQMVEQGINRNDAADLLLHYCILPGKDYLMGRVFYYIPFLALISLTVLLSIKNLMTILNVKRYSGLRKLPDGLDPVEALPRIERQYAEASNNIYRIKPGHCVCFTRNWIIVETPWNIRFHLVDELLWAFISEPGIRLQGPLKVDGKMAVHIVLRGGVIKLAGSPERLAFLLKGLEEAYPWILRGFSYDKVMAWYNDMKSLADSVRRKKEKYGYVNFPLKGDPSVFPEGT